VARPVGHPLSPFVVLKVVSLFEGASLFDSANLQIAGR